jgi:predicted amidohydrolase YtcJ
MVIAGASIPGQEGPQDVAVEGGRIAAIGPSLPGGERIDATGRWLASAFIDAHCHILPTGLDLRKPHLGRCATREEALEAVREAHEALPEGQWLHAVHYDQTRFSDGRHLTRTELDAISATRPILLRHGSGHASVANSAALAAAGVDEATPDPEGGAYGRDASGRLDGLLLELAHEHVTRRMPAPDLEQMVEAILEAGRSMRALGIVAATDMMTGFCDLERELTAYRLASERGCAIRLRLFLHWGEVFGPGRIAEERLRELTEAMDPLRCRAEGIKIFADGAIGSATAAIHGAYLTSGGDGKLIYAPERLKEMVTTAAAQGWRLAVHSIGDRATDHVLDAFEATEDPRRHRIEHAMILSDAQIERMARLGPHVTMQPEFLLRFGHSYRAQLGPERMARLKRLRSVVDAGLAVSLNSDRPIVPGDPVDGIRTAVVRPEGFDPAEALSWGEAFAAYTAGGAAANGDAAMGMLAPGAWADLALYDADPTKGEARVVAAWLAGAR